MSGGAEEKLSAIVRDGIAKTVLVSSDRADELWSKRNKLFFKPAAGFGGRAAYRGDKITRRVWQSILEGGYVAQDLVPPSGRTVIVDGRRERMKLDIRNYTYDGKVQLVAARLYQGQTTNFHRRRRLRSGRLGAIGGYGYCRRSGTVLLAARVHTSRARLGSESVSRFLSGFRVIEHYRHGRG